MENKKINSLVVFLIIVILVLCATIGFLLVYDKDDESNKNSSDITDNGIQNLELNNPEVNRIINKFRISTYEWDIYTYIDERVKEKQLLEIAYINSEDSIINESNCEHRFYGDNSYTCKYIKYDVINENYKILTGKDLPKNDRSFSLIFLKYDSSMDVYRICDIPAGGGPGSSYLSKVDKAIIEDEYIYIYEKVAFANIYYDNSFILPHLYKEYNGNLEYIGETIIVDVFEKEDIIKKEIDKFDTYKWTFKKDSNGEYVYEKLEFIEGGKVDVVHYEFGMPTAESSSSYSDVINKTGSNVLVKKESNGLYVCIYKYYNLECFKTNNYEEEIKHVEMVFSYNCDYSTSDRYCYDAGTSGFRCDIYSNNSVYCCETPGKCCEISSDGTVRCGLEEY